MKIVTKGRTSPSHFARDGWIIFLEAETAGMLSLPFYVPGMGEF